MAEFGNRADCAMTSVYYDGDQTSKDSFACVNELKKERREPFADAIVFKTDFRSPSAELLEGTACEPATHHTEGLKPMVAAVYLRGCNPHLRPRL